MRILLTNDDGYDQPGLLELERTLAGRHEIWTVAPLEPCSGTSQALGLYSRMELRSEGTRKWSLKGTPTDCVKIALFEIMKNSPPDLLVSGINPGANLANNVHYSGTVAAATEAVLWKIPAIAISVNLDESNSDAPHFKTASVVLKALLEQEVYRKLPPGVLLNVNVPAIETNEIKGWEWTRTARFIADIPLEQIEPGKIFTYGSFRELPVEDPEGTDVDAVNCGKISLSLLDSNMTSLCKPPDLQFISENG